MQDGWLCLWADNLFPGKVSVPAGPVRTTPNSTSLCPCRPDLPPLPAEHGVDMQQQQAVRQHRPNGSLQQRHPAHAECPLLAFQQHFFLESFHSPHPTQSSQLPTCGWPRLHLIDVETDCKHTEGQAPGDSPCGLLPHTEPAAAKVQDFVGILGYW